jgi:hypothetical protein
MISFWTKRDLDIVETLTRRVHLLSIDQIIRIWWPRAGCHRVVRRRLRRLAAAGLVTRTIVNVHPVLEVSEPLADWIPEADEPDFARVSANAKARWRWPSIPHELFFATPLAANLYGSSAGRLPDLNHRDHDLLLSEVFVLYRTTRHAEAAQWIGEDCLPKAGYRIKDPDAFLVNSAGEVLRVVESAGRYSIAQIESFHDHCVQYGLPYELW